MGGREMIEIWKDVNGYEGYYKVSNFGRVKRIDSIIKHPTGSPKKWKGRILKQYKNVLGYKSVSLCKSNLKTTKNIHRLVAEAFLSNPKNKPCVNHLNGKPSNNYVFNLEWVTYSENEYWSYRKLGKVSWQKGLKYPYGNPWNKGKIYQEELLRIRLKRITDEAKNI
jgi:hypothetical protein